jgi:hypothetical protein
MITFKLAFPAGPLRKSPFYFAFPEGWIPGPGGREGSQPLPLTSPGFIVRMRKVTTIRRTRFRIQAAV